MKKRILMIVAAVMLTLSANAQFEAGKVYAGASLSGLNLSYNGNDDNLNLGVTGLVGYLFEDNWMITGSASYQHSGSDAVPDYISLGVGGRYYIIQNGIYLGLNCKYVHAYHNYNDVMPGVEVGYAFFISRTCTIEPAVYYDQSFKDHSKYSTVGLKIGFGIYL